MTWMVCGVSCRVWVNFGDTMKLRKPCTWTLSSVVAPSSDAPSGATWAADGRARASPVIKVAVANAGCERWVAGGVLA